MIDTAGRPPVTIYLESIKTTLHTYTTDYDINVGLSWEYIAGFVLYFSTQHTCI